MKGQALKGHLDLLVLGVLSDGPMHGYAVIEELRVRSGDAFDIPEGTLYPVLHRLESAGLLASDWVEVAGRRRRLYRLTERGRAALVSEQAEWQKFASAVAAGARGRCAMAEPDLIEAYLIHLRGCLRFRRDADDVVAEAEDHVRESVERLCRSGADPITAQRITLERFGDPTVVARGLSVTAHGGIAMPTPFTRAAGTAALASALAWALAAVALAFGGLQGMGRGTCTWCS